MPSQEAQQTINERLKILIAALGLSARAFSKTLDVSESTTRNYLDKSTKPSTDYIERIAIHFKSVNLKWLITGEGDALLSSEPDSKEHSDNRIKNNYGNNVGSNRGGTVTQHQGAVPSKVESPNELDMLRTMVAQLQSQLADKERLIQVLLNQSAK